MNNKFNRKKAFTLVEMAVSVLVISILVTGVVKGAGLIKSSRIANARGLTVESVVPEINGLRAWYETTLLSSLNKSQVIENSQITSWFDSSPSSNTGLNTAKNTLTKTASNSVVLVENGINNLPSLKFTSGSLSLSNFYQGNSIQNTVCIVFRPSSPSTTSQYLIDSSSGSSNSGIGFAQSSVSVIGQLTATANNTGGTLFTAENDYAMCVYLNGSSTQIYVNNASTAISASAINIGSNPLNGLTVGSRNTGAAAFSGMISEIIIYGNLITAQERKDVMRYLAKKYNIKVSGT